MKKLTFDLENCYGIKALKAHFDFSGRRAYALYAPNGSMKTSLAQTFKDVADRAPSKDRIFPTRVCKRSITDEAGTESNPRAHQQVQSTIPNEDHGDSDHAALALMTPENIHVNSFMYEPILDMSDEHLRKLYQDVAALDATVQEAEPEPVTV
jgi:hypothetical protein